MNPYLGSFFFALACAAAGSAFVWGGHEIDRQAEAARAAMDPDRGPQPPVYPLRTALGAVVLAVIFLACLILALGLSNPAA